MSNTTIFLPWLDRLIVQGNKETGLVFLPPEDVAAIRNEHKGRLEVVTLEGEVFHLSVPLDEVEKCLAGKEYFLRVSPEEIVNQKMAKATNKEMAKDIFKIMREERRYHKKQRSKTHP